LQTRKAPPQEGLVSRIRVLPDVTGLLKRPKKPTQLDTLFDRTVRTVALLVTGDITA